MQHFNLTLSLMQMK